MRHAPLLIALASLMGALACIAWMRPTRVPQFHLAALLLIGYPWMTMMF